MSAPHDETPGDAVPHDAILRKYVGQGRGSDRANLEIACTGGVDLVHVVSFRWFSHQLIAPPRVVVHHDRLSDRLGDFLAPETREGVCGAFKRVRHHDADRR